jgi:DNA-binding beta-propeller fold protein YncE
MKPGELTSIEDTLRRAYADAAKAVPDDDVGPGVPVSVQPGWPARGASRSGGRRQWLMPAAAGAAVAAVALVAGLLVPTEMQQAPPRPAPPRPMMAYVVGLNSVLPVDLASGRAFRPIGLGVPGHTVHVVMAPHGRTVYVATNGGEVVPIDTAMRTARPPIRIGGVRTDITDVLISPDGHTGYFAEYPYGVATVNFLTNRPGRFIKIQGAGELALTPDGRILYVLTDHGTEVVPVDTATRRTLPPIMTGDYNGFLSARIVMAPDGRTAYVLSFKPGIAGQVLTPIDTATGTVLAPIRVAASGLGAGITISPDSRSAYMDTGYGVMAIDLTTGTIRWTATLGGPNGYYQVAVSPDSQTVYTFGSRYDIDRFDAANGRQLTPILMGWLPTDIAFGPDGKLYLLGHQTRIPASGSWLTRFDPATGAVRPPISLPGGGRSSWGYLVFGPR